MGEQARDVIPEPDAPPGSARGPDFALVVGVDHYPRFRSLQGASADAVAFHAWACDPDGGGVAQEHARLILSTLEPATPIQEQIDEHLLELMECADRLGGGRRLYLYFSGHGATSPGEVADDVALLLARWSKHLARIALSSLRYAGELGSTGLFEELAVFLDCCRTAAAQAIGLPPTITFEPTAARRATRTFLAYATEAGRPAFESPEGSLWQGVFTRCLLQILRRAPHGIEAHALKDRLEREVREAHHAQRAHVIDGLLAGSIFGRRGTLPELRVTFRRARGRVQLLDARGRVVGEREAGDGPWQLEAEPGLYKLQDGAGATLLIDHGPREVTHVEL